jgi:hypothetical protein
MKVNERQIELMLGLLSQRIKRESNLIDRAEYINICKSLNDEKDNLINQPKFKLMQIMI